MPNVSDIQAANPAHLANNTFLVNLAGTFNVTSIPLAIFILIIVLIACVLFIVALVFMVRSCIRRKFIPKKKKRPYKSVYIDEIPGMQQEEADKTARGFLDYSLEYDIDKSQLIINVIQGNHLVPRADVDSLDTYVAVTVVKEQKGTRLPVGKTNRTQRRRAANPSWNQLFTFPLAEKDLKLCTVMFEVFDYDSIGQDYELGQLKLALKDLDQGEYTGTVLEKTGKLGAGPPILSGIGELCVGLSYYPQFGRIDVTVFEARQLNIAKFLQTDKENHIFVEVDLRNKGRKRLGSNSTKTKTDIVNPYFNERMSFPLKRHKLDECSVLCRLRRTGKLGTKKTLGQLELGCSSSMLTGVKQWEEMLKGPSKTHVMWHVLVPKVTDE